MIDLHAHTNHSDGTLEPRALVRLAAERGLRALAVTDHDVTSALAEAMDEGARLGVEVLAGCEVSCRVATANVHVLAYGMDLGHEGFQAFLCEVRASRDDRNLRLLARLAELGYPLAMEEVAAHAAGGILARPHFAQAMIARGYVPDLRAAFEEILGDDGPAFVVPDMPDPATAVERIHAAGGVAVVAHPRQLRLDGPEGYAAFLAALPGLDGLEVDHPSHRPEERRLFRDLARRFGLVETGGSDFHGDNKPWIALGTGDGSIQVPYATWERLLARKSS